MPNQLAKSAAAQTFPEPPDRFSPLVNMSKSRTIKSKPLGRRCLFVEPETASWCILEKEFLNFWQRLGSHFTWQQAIELQHSLNKIQRQEFLFYMFRHGMLNLNGSSFFPSDLWAPPQRWPAFLCLHLTEACNFACRYCMADSIPSKQAMPQKTIKLIIEKCLHELPIDTYTFDFHGGEPLLAFDSLLYAVKLAREINETEKLGKKLFFLFQTNGSLLTPERIQQCIDNNIVVGVSLDGPAEVHDKNRIFAGPEGHPTFATVRDNLQTANKMGLFPGYLGVIHDPADFLKSFHFFVDDLQCRQFRLNYSSYIGRSARLLDFPLERAQLFAEAWLDMADAALAWSREHNENLCISDLDNQINNLLSKARTFMCYRSPCGAANSVLGFAINGGIHACEEMASSGVFCLGNVYDKELNLRTMLENSPQVAELQKRTVDNIPRCSRCRFKRFCYGGCTSKTQAFFNELMRESPMCRYYQVVFEGLMQRLHDNPDMVQRLGGSGLSHLKWPDQDFLRY